MGSLTMTMLNGPLASYFADQFSRIIKPEDAENLYTETRGLIGPFLDNTAFYEGLLDFSFVHHVPVYTIFSRHERNKTPYLLSELGDDLRKGVIDSRTINGPTEDAIRALAKLVGILPESPMPVIVEDGSAQNYLILEGNKRCSAIAFLNPDKPPQAIRALVGHTPLAWPNMLAFFCMNLPS